MSSWFAGSGGLAAWRAARYRTAAWSARTGAGGETALAIPGLLAVGVFVALAVSEGGVRAVSWYPATLVLLLLLGAVALGRGPKPHALGRPALLALALLGAFVAWSFASIAWADAKGVAWDSAGRSLLYFCAFAVFAVWPWRARAAAGVLGVFGLAVAVVGVVVVAQAAGAADPSAAFIKARLADPVGYPNGAAALFLGAVWPLLFLAARSRVPWPVRGVTLAAAGILVQVALLAQSRGSLAAGAVALAAFLALVPGRLRSLLVVAALAAVTLWSLDPVLDVFRVAAREGDVAAALDGVLDGMVAAAAVLFGAGALLGLLDGRVRLPMWRPRPRRRAVAAAGAACLAAGALAAIVAIGDPVAALDRGVEEFTTVPSPQPGSSNFENGLATSRAQFWTVALAELRDRPITGMGAGNFAIAYVRERTGGGEEPLHPHSLPVAVASQTGVVGAPLFAGFLIAVVLCALRVRGAGGHANRGVAAVALVASGYWLVHASGDWLWAIPALAAPAFAWLGLIAGLMLSAGEQDRSTGPVAPFRRRRAITATAVAVVVGALVALAATVPPWLAAEQVDFAERSWGGDAARAFEALETARGLNPLSDEPDLVAGAIASRIGQRDQARRSFARAVERTPRSWYAHQQLGLEEALADRSDRALAHLERSLELNPLEPTTREVVTQVRSGEQPSPDAVRQVLLTRVCFRVPSAGACR
ncbi:MAG: O-antigen ligase family protein [Egibacteraceae bacterium]